MTRHDEFLYSEIRPILQPGEYLLHYGLLRRQPPLLLIVLFNLTLRFLTPMLTTYFYAVLTNRRLILLLTWPTSSLLRAIGLSDRVEPQLRNRAVEQHELSQIQRATASWLELRTSRGRRRLFWTHCKTLSSDTRFRFDLPQLVASGQLARLDSAPQVSPWTESGPALAAQYAKTEALSIMVPGSQVMVRAADGARYPAIITDARQGHYLCALSLGGGQRWFPGAAVAPR